MMHSSSRGSKRYFERENNEFENNVKQEDEAVEERQAKRAKSFDSRPRKNYASQNYHNNSSNQAKPEENEKDEKFQELVEYYEKISMTLKGGLPKEDSDIVIKNILSESQGFEVELSCHKYCSHSIELLLSISKDPEICLQFMRAFAEKKMEVCTNSNASHITELLLISAVKCIDDLFERLNTHETEEDKLSIIYLLSWVLDFGNFVNENLETFLQDQYASHVVCSTIRALGGDTSQKTDFRSKRSAKHKKDYRHQYMGDDTLNDPQYMVSVVLKFIPKSFKKNLKKIARSFLKIENIVDYVTESSSATAIETILCILSKRVPKECRNLIMGISPKIFLEKSDEGIPQAFLHRNCSYVVEKMLQSADEDVQQLLWHDYFEENLEGLIAHPVGNFIIQRLFDVVEDKPQFELLSEKIGPFFEKILSSQRYGIFLSIAGACNRLKIQQSQFMKNIMKCLQCAEPEDRQLKLVPLIMRFRVFSRCNEADICLQGSLLVQALIKFEKPIKVVNSILNMTTQEIANLACHRQGCHVLTSFFGSPSVGEKSKDKLIQLLKKNLAALACDRDGSLTLLRIWVLLSIKQRSTMAQMLVGDKETLLADRSGSVVWNKFGIFHFVNNLEQWKQIQKNLTSNKNSKHE